MNNKNGSFVKLSTMLAGNVSNQMAMEQEIEFNKLINNRVCIMVQYPQ